MERGLKLIGGFILVAGGLLACNSYKAKNQNAAEEPISAASINYQFVHDKVFKPRCIGCHSDRDDGKGNGPNEGDINLESFENVVKELRDIEDVVFVEESMPPKRVGGPLGAYEKSVLRLWIDAGAPREAAEKPQVTPTPAPGNSTEPLPGPPPAPSLTPTPSPTPVLAPVIVAPTWDDIYLKIFEPKCIECHQAGKKAEDYPLTDRAYVIDPANLLLTPGNIDESEIYNSITRQDKKRMPPLKTGVTLSTTEIEAIKLWILNGAKD